MLFNQATNTIDFGSNVTIGSNVDQTVTVGSGGDYATLNLALEHLSKIVPAYKLGGFTATINILSNTIVTEQIHVSGVDLSFIEITSTDTSVEVNTSNFTTIEGQLSFITISEGGSSPVISALFTTNNNQLAPVGLLVIGGGSFAKISSGAGLDSFGKSIIARDGGEVYGYGAILTNSKMVAIELNDGIAKVGNSDISGLKRGFEVYQGSYLYLYSATANGLERVGFISNSTAQISYTDFSGWSDTNNSSILFISNSDVVAKSTDFSGSTNAFNKKIDITQSDVRFDLADFGWGSGTEQEILIEGSVVSIQNSSRFKAQMSKGSTVRAAQSTGYSSNVTPQTLTVNGLLFE